MIHRWKAAEQRPIRVLAVDHTAGVLPFRKKFDALAAHPEVKLTVLAPERWIENYREVRAVAREGPGYSLRIGRVGWPGYENRAFFRSGIGPALRASAPDILHLWEEPFSAIALQALLLARLHAPRAKALFFSSDNLSGDFHYSYRPSLAYAVVERLVHRWCAMGTAVSEEVAGVLRQKRFAKPIEVIPNGVDLADYGLGSIRSPVWAPRRADGGEIRARLGLEPPIVGYLGRLLQQKGIDLLLRAVARLRTSQGARLLPALAVIGTGPDEEQLRSLAGELGLGNSVRFLPGVPHDEVPAVLACLEILVLPSRGTPRWREQFGRVLIEGMAAGCCVVGTRSGGIPEVIADAGIVVPEEGVEELVDALRRLLAGEALRATFRARGIERVRSHYTWEAIARRLVGIYRELLEEGGIRSASARGA
jgi:glycosyltransferase involved in cell wall biosynthesis